MAGPKLVYVSKHDGAPTMKTRNAEGLVDDGRGSGLRARAVIPGGVAIMRWGWRRRYFAGVPSSPGVKRASIRGTRDYAFSQ